MTLFEVVAQRFKVRPLLFWFVVAALYALLFETVAVLYNEVGYTSSRVTTSLLAVLVVPLATMYGVRQLALGLQPLQPIVDLTQGNYADWIEQQLTGLYVRRIVPLTGVTGGVALFAAAVFLVAGETILTTFTLPAVIASVPAFLFAGYAAYAILASLWLLGRVIRLPLKPAFSLPGRLYTTRLSNAFLFLSVMASGVYLVHAASVLITPLRTNSWALAWLLVTAFFPLLLFLWSFYAIHVLLQRIKHHSIVELNEQIQTVMRQIQQKATNEDVEMLHTLIEVQGTLEKAQEWSVSNEEVTTLLITLLIPIIQVVGLVIEML